MTTWWILATTAITALHYLVATRRYGLFGADSLFMLMQWLMVIGTIPRLVPTQPLDADYAYVVAVPTCIYGISSILLALMQPHDPTRYPASVQVEATPLRPTIVGLFILSAAIVLAYFTAVGYNTFLIGLQSLLSGGGASGDVATMRLDSYSGDSYFAPGYVNQFKNAILPVLTIAIAHSLFAKKHPLRVTFTMVAGTFAGIALLGTGQRSAFVVAVAICASALYRVNRQKFRRLAPPLAAAAFAVLAVSTLVLGRGQAEIESAPDATSKGIVLANTITDRFTRINQESGIHAHWYTSQLPPAKGREWAQDISGVLPTSSGSDLANQVYESIYGVDTGTEPPSLWGSINYNFGWPGLILMPPIFAILFQRATRWANQGVPVNMLDLISRSGVCVVLGTWIMSGPSYLLNYGLIAFLGLAYIARRPGRGRLPAVSTSPSINALSPTNARAHRT